MMSVLKSPSRHNVLQKVDTLTPRISFKPTGNDEKISYTCLKYREKA
jgi:hypothetical protein